jgi:hypothetical protein
MSLINIIIYIGIKKNTSKYKDIYSLTMLSYHFLSVIYGGQVTPISHCIFRKLYRRPLGHERDVKVKPTH